MIKITVENNGDTVVYSYNDLGNMVEAVFLFNSILRYLGFYNNIQAEDGL